MLAQDEGWRVTLNHNDEYVAVDVVLEKREGRTTSNDIVLEAETEEDAWKEICGLERIGPPQGGHPDRR